MKRVLVWYVRLERRDDNVSHQRTHCPRQDVRSYP